VTEDRGVYGQAKWRPDERHQLNLGLRYDDNSQYGGSTTVRAGYVGMYGRWGLKALYGEAYQEPNPRLLYGGWTGSGSDPDLAPERSRTAELSGSFRNHTFQATLGVYHVQNRDTIVSTAQGAENLGERRVTGLEAQAQKLLRPSGLQQLRLWAYYSRLFQMDEDHFDAAGRPLSSSRIGDLAQDKLHLGATAVFGPRASLTVLGRYVGRRATVDSNPVRETGAWATLDANLLLRHLGHEGVGASLRVTNLFDAHYFEPGVRDASAGVAPGSFDEQGLWHGSAGYYSSLLPQPGRALTFSVLLEF
jgi:iron complex outermembrane receptor protein